MKMTDAEGCTPLHVAAKPVAYSPEIVRELLISGSDVGAADEKVVESNAPRRGFCVMANPYFRGLVDAHQRQMP